MLESQRIAISDENHRISYSIIVFWGETLRLLSLFAGRQLLVASRYPKVAVCIPALKVL